MTKLETIAFKCFLWICLALFGYSIYELSFFGIVVFGTFSAGYWHLLNEEKKFKHGTMKKETIISDPSDEQTHVTE